MKSILIGNGIDIQFGGKAYSNRFIMNRIIFNALTNKYDILFGNKITGEEIKAIFEGFLIIANDLLKGKYDSIDDPEISDAVKDFLYRFSSKKRFVQCYEIPLEDWFLLFRLFFEDNKDLIDLYIATKQGFDHMILDAIYNDGKIQELYKKMNSKVRDYFSSFDNVFTLNYDNNIESLCQGAVYHLHGDFSQLADSENPNMVQGYCRQTANKTVVIPGFEHCFCNALLNYSGNLKLKQAEANMMLQKTFTEVKGQIQTGDYSYKTKYQTIIKDHPEISEWLETYAANDGLSICSNYQFDKFRGIDGELHILGLSPQNDSHIFKCINESNATKIIFYYFGEKPTSINTDKDVEFRKASDLWNELDANPKQYNEKVSIPNGADSIIKVLNELSFDKISIEELKNELKKYPSFITDPLCEEAEKLMENLKSNGNPKSEKEFKEGFIKVSRIALREGIYPTAFYVMLLQHMNR